MRDELREQYEDLIQTEMEGLANLEAGSKEKLQQAETVGKLMDSYSREEQGISDWFDKQESRRIDEEDKKERRKIERAKNKRMSDIEEKKTKLTAGKAIIEVGKIVVPAVVGVVTTILCIGASRDELDETLQFEETGRINSSGGRSHKRPSFWNKK